MSCKRIDLNSKKICIGDLKKQIILHVRSIEAPIDPSDFDYSQVVTLPKRVWAAIQTTSGKEVFDGVNILGTATHFFYIKYLSGLTSESFLEYNSKYYRILRIENMNEENNVMKLFCNERGDKTIGVNQQ